MATKIRLKRVGRRNRPFYRVVVMDSRKRRDGAALEEVGWYNPIALDKENNYSLKEDRIFYWLGEGAQPTDIAHHLFKRAGIAFKWHLMKQGLDEKAIEKEMQKWMLAKEASKKKEESKAKPATKEAEPETPEPSEGEPSEAATEEPVAAPAEEAKPEDETTDTESAAEDEKAEAEPEAGTDEPESESPAEEDVTEEATADSDEKTEKPTEDK